MKKRSIEIQGGIHDDVLRSEYDAERSAYLESQGIRVLFFDYAVGVIRSAVLE